MSTAEFNLIREELTTWIQTLNDSKLLNLRNSIKLSISKSDTDWWDELTEDQQENIRLGMKDLSEGGTISSKEFWAELRADD